MALKMIDEMPCGCWGGEHLYICEVGKAEAQVKYEEKYKEYDWLGAREDDPAPGAWGNSDCRCPYCRFYRGEGGVRYVMCDQEWEKLSPQARSDIAESCSD